MRVTRVAVVMIMAVRVAIVVVMRTVIVRMAKHGSILRARKLENRLGPGLVGSLTRPLRECIDALPHGCDHETSFPVHVCCCGWSALTGELRSGSWRSQSQN